MKTKFIPNNILYEKKSLEYPLGKKLQEQYPVDKVNWIEIENHNNIPLMREKENVEFPKMKRNLILGIRKTHQYTENHKVSDFLVPYTSSGCIAMCMYCYLVCNYNKCAYLRIFVNREEMLDRLIKKSQQTENPCTFEIGSNSDLVLENTITHNLEWTIEKFAEEGRGKLTFPTKFNMVQDLLNLKHQHKVVIRMSLNPEEIIRKVEFGTSTLLERIQAINQLEEAGYEIGILIAPIILVENWEILYEELFQIMKEKLSKKVKEKCFFEMIFMTYSYIHRKINEEAFPNAIQLYDKDKMTVRGRGKYGYQKEEKEEAQKKLLQAFRKYFPDNRLWYIV